MTTNNPNDGAPAGFLGYLARFWALVLITHRYAMTARFCVIAGLASALVFLTVGQGRETLRALAEPRAVTFAYSLTADAGQPSLMELPWPQLGWFSFATVVLSLACWASTRLCYGLVHQPAAAEHAALAELMERKLPMYFGSLPLVVAGCGFLQEAFTYLLPEHRPTGLAVLMWCAPLGLLFGVPTLVILRWIWRAGDHRQIANSAPGLRYLLSACAALPALAAVWIYCHPADFRAGNAMVVTPFLLVAQYFFLLAIGIYRMERPWIILLPGVVLLILPFCKVVDSTWLARCSIVAAGLGHLLLGIYVRRIPPQRMQEQLRLPRGLKARQLAKMIFFGPAPLRLTLADAELVTLRAAGAIVCILAGILAAVWLDGQWLPRLLGPAAVLCLALTAWVVAGNALLIATPAVHLPLIVFALVWALGCSICEDNHGIRLLPFSPAFGEASPASASAKPGIPLATGPVPKKYSNVAALYRDWHARAREHSPLTTSALPGAAAARRPCFIVSTEGGGIRAAFWTAQVLARLEDESRQQVGHPDFVSHILAISGVSGGSLGAAIFTGLSAESQGEGRPPTLSAAPANPIVDLGSNAAYILGSDHLSPLVGSMLFPDALQRFCPWSLPGTDRGTALEQSWEDRWHYFLGGKRNRFAEPFLDLWRVSNDATQPWLPALFLNATRIEDGRRIIVSNVKITSGPGGEFPDALDLHDYLWAQDTAVHGPLDRLAQFWRSPERNAEAKNSPRQDLRLSTAAHCSARFSYFSPAARLPSGHRLVDGGYYENSGTETALEVLAAVNQVIRDEPDPEMVEPVLIAIRFVEQDDAAALGFPPLTPEPTPATVPAYAASDLLSPILALMDVRSAHATDGYAQLGRLDAASSSDSARMRPVQLFQLAPRRIPLPLGWMLCGRSAGEMVAQMPGLPAPENDSATTKKMLAEISADPAISSNFANLGAVLRALAALSAK